MANVNVMTTTADVDPAVEVTYSKVLLQPPQPKYIYTKYLKQYSIAKKSGNTLKMRRYSRLSAATIFLVTRLPGGIPKHSPIAERTAGAV